MTYDSAAALRAALEQRLINRAAQTGLGLDRLRRGVLFERIVARLEAAQPGRWVLKGGMALEVRLRHDARVTKDIDLGLREEVETAADLQAHLDEAFAVELDDDGFEVVTATPRILGVDGGGHPTWRVGVTANLAGRQFGRIQLDISPRAHELGVTDRIGLPNSLDFAGIPARSVEIVDVNRHAAEKLHAMLRTFGDRENSRVRDLVDVVLLVEHDLLTTEAVAFAVRQVWAERDGAEPPATPGPLPESWPVRYESLAEDYELVAQTFSDAQAVVGRLWTEMFPLEES